MNKDLVSIGDVYGKMLNTFKYDHLKESNKNAFGEQPELVGDGPKTDGYHDALEDEKGKKPISAKNKKDTSRNCDEDEETPTIGTIAKLKEKLKSNKLSDEQKEGIKKQIARLEKSAMGEEAEEEIYKESKKNAGKTLNKFMSKSVFDKLYNKVLKENFGQEEDALGLGDATPDSEMDEFGGGDEFGDEDMGEDDSVTFTLSRDVAQQLVDVLQGVLGDVEEDLGEDDDLDFGDEGGDEFGDEGLDFEEDEEIQGTKVMADKKAVYQGPTKSNKVTAKVAPKSGKASTDVTDEVGTKDGAPPITALQGKSNQIPGSKVKVGDFFK